ncbi:MAG: S41 family peptidase [Anaerolineales bacterium]|nr:S41 family peptidase [Anaerolineales bacterium]
MKPHLFRFFSVWLAVGLMLAACAPVTPIAPRQNTSTPAPVQANTPTPPAPLPTPQAEERQGLYKITGSFKVSNDFVIAVYAVEHAVMLYDLHGFITRDEKWELPVESQVLGFMQVDLDIPGGSYSLFLPVRPQGTLNDVDNDGQTESGVQVFATVYSPNLYGGPFADGDDRSRGWPSYLASVRTDPENDDEVVGGKLIVWAPDDAQAFPSDFGPDGLLFTADDPAAPLPAGYSVVDLDTRPFTVSQPEEADLPLYEPPDSAIKDFSALSYTEALDKLFEFARTNYAFNGIEGKQPNWDELYAQLKPRVEQAQTAKDVNAFYFAIRDFTWAFRDGHVGMGGGPGDQAYSQAFQQATAGGYGLAIRELDDGRVVVIYLTEGGPAQAAGLQIGAEITEFNGKPIRQAIGEVVPWTLPHSMDSDLRYQQQRYLVRAPLDTEATVTFINPGKQARTVTLKAVNERASFSRTSRYFNVETDYLLPVEFSIIERENTQIGYIRINANYDDLNLLLRLFERALKQFQQREVAGVIFDMRYNAGGAPLGLAGFLTDKVIPTGQDEYFSEKTGKFEPEGLPGEILPNQNQYRFEKMALLVAPTCTSACEYEAYGLSQVPGMIVVGFEPTGGVFAEVSRGQIKLPEGISVQIPTGRTRLPDGSIFLEGKGVPPTLRVPVDETTVYREDDMVLEYGIRAILQPLGAGITPASPPKLGDASKVNDALNKNPKQLEELAREQYNEKDLAQVNRTFTYTIALNKSQDLFWAWGWCAKDAATLAENLKKIQLAFSIEENVIPLDQFQQLTYSSSGQQCVVYLTVLYDWPGGEHHLTTKVTFTAPLNDGTFDYPKGEQIFEYTVYVKP